MDGQAPPQFDWLVQTKLQPPLPSSDLISRPRLLMAMQDGFTSHRLTLLSAPAGYGKTSLLAQAIQLPISNLQPPTVAWLTLDEGDNDPALFLAYLVAALQRLKPACGTTAQTLLTDLPHPAAQARRIVGALINDVLETLLNPFALILDDLHLITEPTVHIALDYLLEHLPPPMHLVVGTRHDLPLSLARLRARGQLAELRAPDLRFTPDETAAFLNDGLHLGLSPDDLTTLQSRTEGWPVGLRLLAGSLARIPTFAGRTAFITRLAQTDRHVFDFLADEVLSRQPQAVQTFLLETSILSELTPALCNAVTGRHDAEVILEDLDRRNLFVVNLQPPTYRYHALFAEFLRQQLEREMPARASELHRRAAVAQGTSVQAIGHYLAAEMWEPAAEVIGQVYEQLFDQGLLDTMTGWIGALPPEVRDARPGLVWLLANCALLKGDSRAAQSLLGQALHDSEAAGNETAQGETLAYLVTTAFLQADFERAGALIHRALAYPVPRRGLVPLLMARANLGLYQGDWAQAEADFAAALALTEESDEPLVWQALAFYLGPDFAVLPGGLERIKHFCRQATTHVREPLNPLQLVIKQLMTFVHLWRGRLEQAIRAGEKALEIKQQLSGYPFLGIDAAAHLAVTHAAQGDYDAADHFFGLLLDLIGQTALYEAFAAGYLYMVGRTRWLQACTEPGRSSRLEEARQAYARMCEAENGAALPQTPVLRLMMRALLEMAGPSIGRGRRYAVAERSLREAMEMERTVRVSALYGSARLLLAHLYLAWDRPEDTLAELGPVLAQCKREGTPGLILKEGGIAVPVLQLAVEQGVHNIFATHLLDLLGATHQPRPVPVPETGQTLTLREVEVLRLIATGASNRAIAEQLVITERTVKAHVSHILRKLDVSSRTQAAARARDLRIV